MSYHVTVTIPNHREVPNQAIARHHFDNRSEAERYAARVEAHGLYTPIAEACGGCDSFDVTKGE